MAGSRAPAASVWIALLLFAPLVVSGCASSRRQSVVEPYSVPAEPAQTQAPAAGGDAGSRVAEGVYHVVQPGQTMWRIARAYGMTPEELAGANAIEDPTQLEVGQALFVPGASSVVEVEPYPAPVQGAAPQPSVAGDPAVAVTGDWIWPLPKGRIISYFGTSRGDRVHKGIDIRGRRGEKVLASRAGRVAYSGSGMRGYGQVVILDHGDGFRSLYAHNSKLLVRVNQRVDRGQPIALVGRSGNASGDHCHFEIRRHDRPVDPLLYLLPPLEARR